MKHTQGPWTSTETRVDCCPADAIESNGKRLALVVRRDKESEANAKLIHSAPELLEALTSIIELGKRGLENSKYDVYFEQARAAIDKATK